MYRHTQCGERVVAIAAIVASFILCHSAAAQWKPAGNVEIVIPTSAGTGSDATGRWIQQLLREKKLVEASIAVVNKPGGATSIAMAYLNQHAGNGHYFMVANPALLTSQLTGSSKFSHTDITPLAQVGTESVVFVVRADSPLKNAAELAARFKSDTGSIRAAFANALGNQNHVAVAQAVKSAGGSLKQLKAVVFNGSGEALTALLGGHVDLVTISASPVLQHVKAGRLRILAVSAEKRLPGELSEIPTWKETGIQSISSNWRLLAGPRGMTEQQIAYWDGVFARLVQLPEWKEDMDKKLMENTYLNASQTRKMLDVEYAELKQALTELGLAK